jgi:cytosine/adenosine deaminase-related metal-dependent hydrolase
MRKFSAHLIYPVGTPPIPYGIVETDEEGTIVRVRETGGRPVEEAGLEFYPGILIPGMINAHCHLELSHLRGRIPAGTGLAGFVSAVSQIRDAPPNEILKAAEDADHDMYRQGISGCGDISNTGLTAAIKTVSPIRYHTFLEVFGLDRNQAITRMEEAVRQAGIFLGAGLPCTLSPHAPYSLCSELWNLLSQLPGLTQRISIHHDESQAERQLLENRTGPMADGFRKAGMDIGNIPADAGEIMSLLEFYLPGSRSLLVHNTLTDPDRARKDNREGNFWVLCPRSNRYIEERLPDVAGLARTGIDICLGTDSLASNDSLSILEEMKLVLENAPDTRFETVLRWATLNGARALGFEETLGSIEPGKRPGLVNIGLFDWEQKKPAVNSRPLRLI